MEKTTESLDTTDAKHQLNDLLDTVYYTWLDAEAELLRVWGDRIDKAHLQYIAAMGAAKGECMSRMERARATKHFKEAEDQANRMFNEGVIDALAKATRLLKEVKTQIEAAEKEETQ